MDFSNKKTLIVGACAIAIILAIIGVYFLWTWYAKTAALRKLQSAGEVTDKVLQDATKGVIPSLETNPLENKPDINPADAANPIKKIKTNPFE